MIVEIYTTEGKLELLNTAAIAKCFSLPSGDTRINLIDKSYIVTDMPIEGVLERVR